MGHRILFIKLFFLFEIKILLFEFLGQSGFENTLVKFSPAERYFDHFTVLAYCFKFVKL